MKLSVLFAAAIYAGIGAAKVVNEKSIRPNVGCGQVSFNDDWVVAAAEGARVLHNTNGHVGPRNDPKRYPEDFKNMNGHLPILPLDQDCQLPLEEFPLMQGSYAYPNGDPGIYRVVVRYDPKYSNNVRVCGVIFHINNSGQFQVCDWRKP